MLLYLLHIFSGKSSRAQREVYTLEVDVGVMLRA